jgi:hypothetical protein
MPGLCIQRTQHGNYHAYKCKASPERSGCDQGLTQHTKSACRQPKPYLRFLWNSSSNSRPQMDSPPVPSPLGSPVCTMKPLITRWNSSL